MGKMTIKCNSEQLKYIQKDFEDASVPVDMSYGPFHKGKSEVNLFYDDAEDGIVEGIVKYRMSNYSAPPMGMSNRLTVVLQQELH